MTQLFQQEALDKKRGRKQKHNPVSLLNTPLRACLWVSGVLAIGALGWAIFARVPLKATGYGIVVPNGEVNTVPAPTSGTVVYLFGNGRIMQNQDFAEALFDFLQDPNGTEDKELDDIALKLDQSLRRISEAGSPARAAIREKDNSNNTRTPPPQLIKRGTALAMIDPLSRIEKFEKEYLLFRVTKTSGLNSIAAEKRSITANKIILNAKREILDRMKALEAKGFLSRTQVIKQISEVNSVVTKLEQSRLNIESKKEEIKKARAAAILAATEFASDSVVYALKDLYILEALQQNRQFVSGGDGIIATSQVEIGKPEFVPAFFSNKEAIKVAKGMRVIATPTGVSRAQAGGVKGEIADIQRLPATDSVVRSLVGLKAGAELIRENVRDPTTGVIRLEQDKNTGAYIWSSGNVPNIQSMKGSVLDVSVTTANVAPISLVIPTLKKFFGLVPPENVPNKNEERQRQRERS